MFRIRFVVLEKKTNILILKAIIKNLYGYFYTKKKVYNILSLTMDLFGGQMCVEG